MKKLFAIFALLFLFVSVFSQKVSAQDNNLLSLAKESDAEVVAQLSGSSNYPLYSYNKNFSSTNLQGYVLLDIKTNEIKEVGLYLQYADENGNLSISRGNELLIVSDKVRLKLRAKNAVSESKNNSGLPYYMDYAYYPCSKEDFEKIAFSTNLKLKIYGREGSKEYGEKEETLTKLMNFYMTAVIR